jgi:hypothetical protein
MWHRVLRHMSPASENRGRSRGSGRNIQAGERKAPLTRFRKTELDDAISHLSRVCALPSRAMAVPVDPGPIHQPTVPAIDAQPSRPTRRSRGPTSVLSHQTPQRNTDGLTDEVFMNIWEHGSPLVVSIADSTDFSPWTPNALAEKYGEDECLLVDCETGKHCAKATTVGAFFKDFSKCFTRSQSKKLKVRRQLTLSMTALHVSRIGRLRRISAQNVKNYTRAFALCCQYPAVLLPMVSSISPRTCLSMLFHLILVHILFFNLPST